MKEAVPALLLLAGGCIRQFSFKSLLPNHSLQPLPHCPPEHISLQGQFGNSVKEYMDIPLHLFMYPNPSFVHSLLHVSLSGTGSAFALCLNQPANSESRVETLGTGSNKQADLKIAALGILCPHYRAQERCDQSGLLLQQAALALWQVYLTTLAYKGSFP